MEKDLLNIIPVLPSQDINRDVEWYENHTGFNCIYKDKMYAVLRRGAVGIHLQWHADNEDDPLLGGSVIRISVEDIHPIFKEFVEKGTVDANKLRLKTAWNTNEFGFYDLNKNALFITESL